MPPVYAPRVSVVINTLNRAEILGKVLRSFLWQKYPGEFELIVVNGPSTDGTEAVLAEWAGQIRVGRCPEANLSISRNVGINMARGEWVVFIDDDAFPEPEWLAQIIAAGEEVEVGAVTGYIFDHTGRKLQYSRTVVNRLYEVNLCAEGDFRHRCFPKSFEFPAPQGGNVAFRRSALLEVGGFDEEIEYYGEETDVGIRLIDAGYLILHIPRAFVHHKSAPSNVRDNSRVLRRWYPILKNRVYFTLKHAGDFASPEEIERGNERFFQEHRDAVKWHIGGGRLGAADLARFESEAVRAKEVGIREGAAAKWKHMREVSFPDVFLPFGVVCAENALNIVLVSQHYLPEHDGGIPTFTRDLAVALAGLGHVVHVIAETPDIERVDFENDVWVHRIFSESDAAPDVVAPAEFPPHIWNWSVSALREVRRISAHRKIDVVEAPIWDCQGAAFHADGAFPLVTSLHTTLSFWMESNPMRAGDPAWMNLFGSPMLEEERALMAKSDAVRANSQAIMTAIESAYPMKFDPARTIIVPHGMPDTKTVSAASSRPAPGEVVVLFVGRLEKRKGIDTLLQAIPLVLQQCPEARFRIIGDDTLSAENGKTYKKAFLSTPAAGKCGDRIRFEGRVSQETLDKAYRDCDIFVAPSRFESFGLVFLEAMREGKPVVGCRAGGMPEVVADGDNGLLVEPEDFHDLAHVLIRLVKSAETRKAMGDRGRARFEEKFTSRRMAQESLPLYRLAMDNHAKTIG